MKENPWVRALVQSLLVMSVTIPGATQWVQQGSKLVGTGTSLNPYQGSSVAISADGNTAIVGGYNEDNGKGAAWIWIRNGGAWGQQGLKLVGSGASEISWQGYSVAISADGNTIIVGGPYDYDEYGSYGGAAWVFVRNGGTWIQQGPKLRGSGAELTSGQGCSVAISADGNTAIVGGDHDGGGVGAAWIWVRSGESWSQQGPKLVASDREWASQGSSVALSADGSTAIVGGWTDNTNIGAAWVWTRQWGSWTQQAKLVGSGVGGQYGSQQGTSVALSADGDTAIVGGQADSDSIGAAWIWRRSGGTWTQQGPKLVGSGSIGESLQGHSVTLSADGDMAMIGGYGDNNWIGAAWVFKRSGGSWVQIGAKLVGNGFVGTGNQGSSVSISADGHTAMVGGPWDNNYAGAVWAFVASPNCVINCAPAAMPSSGQAPLTVTFAANASATDGCGTPVYVWSFGDGQTSNDQNPSHIYNSAGTFNWTMTVSASATSCSKSGTVTVTSPYSVTISGHAFLQNQILIKNLGRVVAHDSSGAEAGSATIGSDGAYSLALPRGPYWLECQIGYPESTGNNGDLRPAKLVQPWAPYQSNQVVNFTFPRPIVMIHGILSSPLKWEHWISWMNANRPEIIVFTPTYDDTASYEDEAASVKADLEWDFAHLASDVPDFTIIGHSKGGLVARAFACKNQGQTIGNALKEVILLGTPNNGSDRAGCDLFHLCKCQVKGDEGSAGLNTICPDFPGLAGHVHAVAGTASTWGWLGLVWQALHEDCDSNQVLQVAAPPEITDTRSFSGPNDGAVEVDSALTIEVVGRPKKFLPGIAMNAGHIELGCASTLGLLSDVILPYLVDGTPFPSCPSNYFTDYYPSCAADTPVYPDACLDGRGYDVHSGQCGVVIPVIGAETVSLAWQAPSNPAGLTPPSLTSAFNAPSAGVCGVSGSQTIAWRISHDEGIGRSGQARVGESSEPVLLGYCIYRNDSYPVPISADTRVGNVSSSQLAFVDNWPRPGSGCYVVTAMYDRGESEASNTIAVGVPGDCDSNGTVSIGEVQKAINMFLGTQAPGCGVDCDGNGQVSIGEVQKVINCFLGTGCTCVGQ